MYVLVDNKEEYVIAAVGDKFFAEEILKNLPADIFPQETLADGTLRFELHKDTGSPLVQGLFSY